MFVCRSYSTCYTTSDNRRTGEKSDRVCSEEDCKGPYGVITLACLLWLESNGGMSALPHAASFLPTSKGLVNYHVNCLLYEEGPASPSVRHSNEHKKCFLVRMEQASKDGLIIHEQSGILNQLASNVSLTEIKGSSALGAREWEESYGSHSWDAARFSSWSGSFQPWQ